MKRLFLCIFLLPFLVQSQFAASVHIFQDTCSSLYLSENERHRQSHSQEYSENTSPMLLLRLNDFDSNSAISFEKSIEILNNEKCPQNFQNIKHVKAIKFNLEQFHDTNNQEIINHIIAQNPEIELLVPVLYPSLSFREEISYIQSIVPQFLAASPLLTRLDLDLPEITQIGDNFLKDWKNLKEINLRFPQVTRIGDEFLSGCTVLTQLDLSSLNKVTQIEESFLKGCSGLTQLDLAPLNKITQIEKGFLRGCSSLTQLDLSPLNKVTQIEESFLKGCSGLTQLDLSPLNKVTQIGNSFLYNCSGLTQLDLSPLNKVTRIGACFLSDCERLTQLDLSPLNKVTRIGACFLSGCSSLTQLDLSPLTSVQRIGYHFLRDCTNLKTLDCTHLPQGVSIPFNNSLINCPNIETIYLNQELFDKAKRTCHYHIQYKIQIR